jgi:G3E family GTPase
VFGVDVDAVAGWLGSYGGDDSPSLELDRPVDWVAFGVWLTMLLHRHGERVLRVKGIVDAEDFGPVFINSVQHVISPPEHAREIHGGVPARLILILRELSPAAVARSFHAFQAA